MDYLIRTTMLIEHESKSDRTQPLTRQWTDAFCGRSVTRNARRGPLDRNTVRNLTIDAGL